MTGPVDQVGPGPLSRAFGWLAGRRRRSPTADRWLLAAAAAGFVTAFVVGLRAVPSGTVEVTVWPFVVLALVAVPLASLANAAEYVVAARIGGRTVPVGEAIDVSILSSAANLLPLPGAALVRVQAMRRGGTTYRRALSVTLLVGATWLATSLVLAAALLGADRGAEVSTAGVLAVTGAGVVGLLGAVGAVHRLVPAGDASASAVRLVGAEVLAVAVATLRFVLVLRGLGLDADLGQAVALTVAGVLASAAGFVPGGLGLREALAGVIAGLVGLPVATGVLAAAVDRLVGLPVLAVLAAAVAARGRARANGAAPPGTSLGRR